MIRLPNGSSRSVPTIACSGTPAWRARVPISPTSLPSSVCSSSLPSPVPPRAAARIRASKSEGVEDPRRARLEHGAVRGPQPAREPAGAAGHRHAARVAREGRPPARPAARSSRSTISGSAPFWGPNTFRRPRTPCARRTAPRAWRRAARRAPRSPRWRPRRRRWSPSRRRRRGSPARPPRRRRRSAARCRRCEAAQASRSPSARPGRARWPSPSRRSRCRRPRPARSRPARPAERVLRLHRRRSRRRAAVEQRVERALAAVGDRAQVRRHQPARAPARGRSRPPPRRR